MPLLTISELEQMSPLFRGRVGNVLARCAMRMLRIHRLNALYDRHCHLRGPDFVQSALQELGIKYELLAATPEVLTQINTLRQGTPFISISNHPYGSIDGVILAECFGRLCPDYKIMVNKVLERVDPLTDSFIFVTPHTANHDMPSRESILGMRRAFEHLRSGGALGLFPAGAVSNLCLRDGSLRDREWQLPVIRLIAKAQVPILPVRFFGGNSLFYYLLGLIHWRIRLLRLPAELFNKEHSPICIGIGPLISVEEQQQYLATHTIEEFGRWLRSRVEGLGGMV